MKQPFLSIVIPCRNEELFIRGCLELVLSQDYDKNNVEIFVIDGVSSDQTAEIVNQMSQHDSRIQYVLNPDKTVPFALNSGIRKAKGDFIVRMDAHCKYPKDYLSQLINWHQRIQADNIGGVLDTVPSNSTVTAQAIAYTMGHSFGVGNSYCRIGSDQPKMVDTVPFGCYRRDVFEKIGNFDLELTRNQDDEFNSRLIKEGGKIYLVPDIKITYFARPRISNHLTMFFQYGLYKPLVALKIGKPTTIRQLVPPAFVLSLALFLGLGFFYTPSFLVFGLILSSYLCVCAAVSFKITRQSKLTGVWTKLRLMLALMIAFLGMHVSYGLGYLLGFKKLIFRQKNGGSDLALSR